MCKSKKIRMNKQLINLIIAISLILSIGLMSGYALGHFRASKKQFPAIKTVTEINPGITTIKFLKVENGKLFGKIDGNKGRLVYSATHILEVGKGEEFTIPLGDISLQSYYRAQNIPENVLFMASRKGKYYYSVFDKSAYRIKSENRIYFESETEAEEMGFLKRD